MKQIILLFLCFLPLAVFSQEIKDLTQEELLADKDYIALQSEIKPVEDKLSAIIKDFEDASTEKKNDPDFKSSIESRHSEVVKELTSVLRSFISNHPDSYVSLIVLRDLANPNSGTDSPTLIGLYNSLSEPVKKTDMGEILGAHLLSETRTAIGAEAPDFTENDPSGNPVKLSDFRGKYLLIDFWASWCGPCRMENPNVVNAYAQFKNKNFEILGVSLDTQNSKNAWLNAIQNDNLIWAQVSDLKGWKCRIALLYGVENIPQNFLIDPNGVIIAKNLRGEDLISKLQSVLK